MDNNISRSELDILMHFLPVDYINEVMIPATKKRVINKKLSRNSFNNVTKVKEMHFIII